MFQRCQSLQSAWAVCKLWYDCLPRFARVTRLFQGFSTVVDSAHMAAAFVTSFAFPSLTFIGGTLKIEVCRGHGLLSLMQLTQGNVGVTSVDLSNVSSVAGDISVLACAFVCTRQ